MTRQRISCSPLTGIWIPLITPFNGGELDEPSIRKLAKYYIDAGATGFVLAATTGEAMTLDEKETRRLVDVVQEVNTTNLPVILGRSGSNTRKLAEQLRQADAWPIDGYLIPTPYYVKPSQEGMYQHFNALVDATELPIIIYNIPYRTGVNMLNDTMFRLAELPQIIGVKDCCANAEQSADLIENHPDNFSVMIGDDANFFNNVSMGADGGILASAHVAPEFYLRLLSMIKQGRQDEMKAEWDNFAQAISLVFSEPNPSPLKFWMYYLGLISSPEVRLPMLPVSTQTQDKIKAYLGAQSKAA